MLPQIHLEQDFQGSLEATGINVLLLDGVSALDVLGAMQTDFQRDSYKGEIPARNS